MEIMLVQVDQLALESIKEKSRPRYEKIWGDFKGFVGPVKDWDVEVPTEDEVLRFVRWLRLEKGMASSSLWTVYSMLNAGGNFFVVFIIICRKSS